LLNSVVKMRLILIRIKSMIELPLNCQIAVFLLKFPKMFEMCLKILTHECVSLQKHYVYHLMTVDGEKQTWCI